MFGKTFTFISVSTKKRLPQAIAIAFFGTVLLIVAVVGIVKAAMKNSEDNEKPGTQFENSLNISSCEITRLYSVDVPKLLHGMEFLLRGPEYPWRKEGPLLLTS